MKVLTVKSGDGGILKLQIPEIIDLFPEIFRKPVMRMEKEDWRLLENALQELIFPQEDPLPDPSPEEIAEAAQRGLSAMKRIHRG